MCCTWLTENAGLKNRQNFAIWASSHNFVGLYLRNQGMYQQSEKKLVKQQYLHHTSWQYGELQPTNGWDRFRSFGHLNKFQRVSHLAFVTTSLTGTNQTLHNVSPSPGLVLYIYIFGGSCPDRILSGAKFTLRPSLAFVCLGSVTAQHSSSRHQPNFTASYKEWNYGTFTERGHHLYSAGRPSCWALAHILVLLLLFSSPILSSRRLDVYHTIHMTGP